MHTFLTVLKGDRSILSNRRVADLIHSEHLTRSSNIQDDQNANVQKEKESKGTIVRVVFETDDGGTYHPFYTPRGITESVKAKE